MELKLFECRILWKDAKGISRFTLLDVNKRSAQLAVHERLKKLGCPPKGISKMVTTELSGPFKAGDFIHHEYQYMSSNEFIDKEF